MSAKIIDNNGSGKVKDDSIFDFSYAEDVTPLDPTSSAGGSSQISISAIEDDSNVLSANTKLMINNTLKINSDYGDLQFLVKKVSTNAGGAATITGDSVQARLNVEKTLAPVSTTLYDAIIAYCASCGVTPYIEPTLQTAMQARSVAFISWKGNVWEYLKMLCSAFPYSATEHLLFEMYFTGTQLGFRKAINTSDSTRVGNLEYATDISQSIETFEAAKTVDVYNYNTSYGTNKILYDLSNYDKDADPKKVFLSSVSDTFQVDAGETVTKLFNVDVTLTSINQPVCVEQINLPYTGGDSGKYVVVGNDNIRILPKAWTDYGGSLTVKTTENPGEISITVVAPPKPFLTGNSGGLSSAPYRVGVETSIDGTDYPALWLTGTGVFYNKKLQTFTTGSDSALVSKDAGATVDNPFISNSFVAANAGLAAAQKVCGPSVKIDASLANDVAFSQTVGKVFTKNNNKFRIDSVNFNPQSASVSASACATIADFDAMWSGKTFSNFTTALTGIAFNEFSVMPLAIG